MDETLVTDALLKPADAAFNEEAVPLHVDGLTLAATLHLPRTPAPPPVVIGLHGLMSHRGSAKQLDLALACNRGGIAYLRLDHRGCGESEGDFEAVTSLEGRVRDLMAAVAFVRRRKDLSQEFGLFGSSLGGAVCLAGFADIQPAACVTLAAPIRSRELHDAVHDENSRPIPATFLREKLQFDISREVGQCRRLLLFHGDADTVVPVSHAREIYEKAASPKRLVIHPGGDHRMTHAAHQREFLILAPGWFAEAFRS